MSISQGAKVFAMTKERTTVVDFVARGDTDDEWKMVLVEEGPWGDSTEAQLHRIQDRLYGCLDAAIDGHLAEKFPETEGKRLTIRLDCYNVPKAEVSAYFERFSKGVLATSDYKAALQGNKHARSVEFEVTFDEIH